jgi:hypothetical protein
VGHVARTRLNSRSAPPTRSRSRLDHFDIALFPTLATVQAVPDQRTKYAIAQEIS